MSSRVNVLTGEALAAKVAEGGLASSSEPPGDVGKLTGTPKAKKGAIRRPVAVLRGLAADMATKAPLGEAGVAALPREVRVVSGLSVAERIEQARQSGYEEGYIKGHDSALSSIEADRLETTRKLAEVIGNAVSMLAESRHEVMAASSREIVDLACQVAEAILLRELAVSKNPGREALQRALDIVPEGSDLVVHMHPDDVAEIGNPAQLQQGMANLDLGHLSEGTVDGGFLGVGSLDIVPDSTVEKGGCVVQAGSCRIDAQVSAALQRVTDLLHSSLPDSDVSLDKLQGGGE